MMGRRPSSPASPREDPVRGVWWCGVIVATVPSTPGARAAAANTAALFVVPEYGPVAGPIQAHGEDTCLCNRLPA